MAETLPLAYDVTHFDEVGHAIDKRKVLRPLSPDTEREVQFHERAVAAGATDYSVRLMRPDEVKAQMKAERKAQGHDFGSRFFRGLSHAAGLDDLMGMIAYLEKDDNQLTGIHT